MGMSIQESEATPTNDVLPVEASEIETPVSEAPEAGAPQESGVPATEGEAPAVPAEVDPFADYGGKDVVEQAYKIHQATQSEDGVIQLFIEAGQSLGLGLREIQELFEGGSTEEAEPDEEYDPDEPMTRAEFQAEMDRQAQAQWQGQAQQIEQAARQTVAATAQELGLDLADPASQVILQMGDKYLGEDLSPANVAAAVRRGHADYQALVEKESQVYLAKKAKAAQTVPSAPAGSSAPTEPKPAEPRDIAEAIKIARKKFREQGGTT
jgi:DNA-binding transcriptional MerR regulator